MLESKRAKIYFEEGYIDSMEQMEYIAWKIDEGIEKVESYLQAYSGRTIEFYLRSGTFMSYSTAEKIVLSGMKEKRSPYLHEITHIVAGVGADSLWLVEGLAVYLNDKLNGFPCFPNGLMPIDEYARIKYGRLDYFRNEFNFTGLKRDSRFGSRFARAAFYAFSGSFVKYLDSVIGTEAFMDIYESPDYAKKLLSINGMSVGEHKNRWEEYLRTIEVRSADSLFNIKGPEAEKKEEKRAPAAGGGGLQCREKS